MCVLYVCVQAVFETIVAVGAEREKMGCIRRLPRKLMLSLDNTTKQNKGRYLAGFLALLVRQGTFEEAYMMYLPVGHTHDLVDQMFSRFAVHLRTNHALSRSMLARCIKKSFQDKYGRRPKVFQWETVANVSGWMDRVGVKEIKGVLVEKWRNFRFSKIGRRTVMQVRSNLRNVPNDEWRGIKEGTHSYNVFEGCGPPTFVQDCKDGSMLPAQRTNPMQSKKPITPEERGRRWAKRQKNLDQLRRELPSLFKAEHYDDCMEILRIEMNEEPIEWNWDPNLVIALMGEDDVLEPGEVSDGEDANDDDDELERDENDDGNDDDNDARLHPWAGHELPWSKKCYIRRDGECDIGFKLYRVMFRCYPDNPSQWRHKEGGLAKIDKGAAMPAGTLADDPMWDNIWFACEQLHLKEGETDAVAGKYTRARHPFDTALRLDGSWQYEVNVSQAGTIYKPDQKKLKEWIDAWSYHDAAEVGQTH